MPHVETHRSAINYTMNPTSPKLTPASGEHRFAQALDNSAGALLNGVEAASVWMPGGHVVSAAVRGARSTDGSSLSGYGYTGGGLGTATGVGGKSTDSNMDFLRLQEEISAENRRYTTLSNVLKTRHETAKAAINNIR